MKLTTKDKLRLKIISKLLKETNRKKKDSILKHFQKKNPELFKIE